MAVKFVTATYPPKHKKVSAVIMMYTLHSVL